MLFQTSVGVDIRPDRVAVVCLKQTVSGIRLSAHSLFTLNQERDDRERLNGFSEWLHSFLKENKVAGRGMPDIYIGVPRELAVIKKIQLPLAVKENLYSAVRFDLDKHVPLPADEVCFDCHILAEDKTENQLHILLVIARKKDVMRYLEQMDTLGRIAGIDLSAAGLVNFLEYRPEQSFSETEIADIIRNRNGGAHQLDVTGSGLPTPDLAPAFGLALKGLTTVPVDLNLIPPALRKKPSRLGIYTMLVLVMLAILSLLALGGSYFVRQNRALKQLDTRLNQYTAQVSDLGQIRQRTAALEERLSYFHTMGGGQISPLDVLRELTRIIPETAWVQELSYRDKEIQLDGYAETATELIPLLEASPMFRDVVFLSSITRSRDGKERFRIGLEINS